MQDRHILMKARCLITLLDILFFARRDTVPFFAVKISGGCGCPVRLFQTLTKDAVSPHSDDAGGALAERCWVQGPGRSAGNGPLARGIIGSAFLNPIRTGNNHDHVMAGRTAVREYFPGMVLRVYGKKTVFKRNSSPDGPYPTRQPEFFFSSFPLG